MVPASCPWFAAFAPGGDAGARIEYVVKHKWFPPGGDAGGAASGGWCVCVVGSVTCLGKGVSAGGVLAGRSKKRRNGKGKSTRGTQIKPYHNRKLAKQRTQTLDGSLADLNERMHDV